MNHDPSQRPPCGKRFGLLLALVFLSCTPLGLVGCSRMSETASAPVEPPRSEVESGPIRLTAELSPGQPALSDRPVLNVTVEHEPDVSFELLPIGEELGDFRVLETTESLPTVEQGRDRITYHMTLEPKHPGDLEIWPVAIAYTDYRAAGDGKRHTLETRPLRVKVTSMIESESPSLAELRPDASPVELPFSYAIWVYTALGATGVGLAGWYAWSCYQARERNKNQRPPTPRELAARELDELLAARLAQRDVKRFYLGLTGVVRRFIERTTGIRAPEQTTEEFLREISTKNQFDSNENRRLKNFLESADLVKFAAHRPAEEDIEQSVERAKDFAGLNDNPTSPTTANSTDQENRPAEEVTRC